MNKDEIISKLANRFLGISLETRGSDELDFHEVSVWTLRDLLSEVFEAGNKYGYHEAMKLFGNR